jgi:hypothetical protein
LAPRFFNRSIALFTEFLIEEFTPSPKNSLGTPRVLLSIGLFNSFVYFSTLISAEVVSNGSFPAIISNNNAQS